MTHDQKIKALLGLVFVLGGLMLLKVMPPADGQPPMHPLVQMQPDPTRAPATWCGGER